ncbi:PA2817 family protein [Halopseudomonas yangmingensis]|uniref:Dehydrogenase n=1 Tax=Halopseudomonas yangmingensis TaxID=1720063 RepID=A0A1I4S927_9GAMM|nr:PA2817 family protein [Halopseudomonas yangmingensis]SFM60841.1 hypothetical protein SAMN05216217_10964 [Halopseudomonas yangmingensis]
MSAQSSYHAYHLALLESLFDTLHAQAMLMDQLPEESHEPFMERFAELLQELRLNQRDCLYEGQEILCQIISRYPQIAHLIPRELLWFFGGDCLHFMPDEEIARFQALDEQRALVEARGEHFDWASAMHQRLQ